MTRGESSHIKVHYKGEHDDFIIFLDNVDQYKSWLTDRSIPLSHFVSAFKIFVTHKQGAQGTYDEAAKSSLENEFGTHVDDAVIKQILEKGSIQESQFPERQGTKNDSQGERVSH